MSIVSKYNLQMDLMYSALNDPIKVTQNDYNSVVFRITITANDTLIDITGNTVSIVIDNKDNVAACTIVDAGNGIVEYALNQDDTAVVGDHQFVLELITADSRVTTQRCKYTVIEDIDL
jgi:hypothetical protein